jgi:tripartite-type tricarboxylate transporter receptor subunit TctC
MKPFSNLTVVAASIALSAIAVQAHAQPYPSQPIKMIVPFTAGGTTDILARTIGQKLSEAWRQPVIVENRPGAGGNIGADVVAKAKPDGYTILMGTIGTQSINSSLYAKMPYDAAKDFAPVTLVAMVPNVLVVNPAVNAKTVRELVALAKAKPGELNFASSSTGGSPHLSGEMFKQMTGADIVHVPYKGSAPAITDLLGGQVSLMFDNLPSALPQVKAGKLRALAVTSARRSQAAPDIPTLAESGVPGYEVDSWFGILAPAGTPKEIVNQLNAEIVRILKIPQVRERLLEQGAEPVGDTPEHFADHIRNETVKWARVVKASGAKAD